MKEYGPESIRNIAFIGHSGSGKTSLSEVLLYTTREINHIKNDNRDHHHHQTRQRPTNWHADNTLAPNLCTHGSHSQQALSQVSSLRSK